MITFRDLFNNVSSYFKLNKERNQQNKRKYRQNIEKRKNFIRK